MTTNTDKLLVPNWPAPEPPHWLHSALRRETLLAPACESSLRSDTAFPLRYSLIAYAKGCLGRGEKCTIHVSTAMRGHACWFCEANWPDRFSSTVLVFSVARTSAPAARRVLSLAQRSPAAGRPVSPEAPYAFPCRPPPFPPQEKAQMGPPGAAAGVARRRAAAPELTYVTQLISVAAFRADPQARAPFRPHCCSLDGICCLSL